MVKIILLVAVPVGILSYLLFTWSIRSGRITNASNHKSLTLDAKKMRKTAKMKKIKTRNPVHNKWLKFGGGFYGTVALWTFLVVEIGEIYEFFVNFIGITEMAMNVGPGLVINFFIESLQNFIMAAAWPAYWFREIDSDLILLWLATTYICYSIGMRLARKKTHAEKSFEEEIS